MLPYLILVGILLLLTFSEKHRLWTSPLRSFFHPSVTSFRSPKSEYSPQYPHFNNVCLYCALNVTEGWFLSQCPILLSRKFPFYCRFQIPDKQIMMCVYKLYLCLRKNNLLSLRETWMPSEWLELLWCVCTAPCQNAHCLCRTSPGCY